MLTEALLADIEAYLSDAYLPDKGIGWFVPPALTERSEATYAKPGEPCADIPVGAKPNEYSTLVATKFDEKSKGRIKERVFACAERLGIDDAALSEASGVSPEVIARLRAEDDYRPSKNALLALSIGLHLSVEQAAELLAFEGHDFRRGSRFDLIVRYCLDNGLYELDAIDELMTRYGEAHLGA